MHDDSRRVLLADATDVFQLGLSPAGIVVLTPAGEELEGTDGSGTLADPLEIPFAREGVMIPGGSYSGLFYNRVGYGTDRWLPVVPGRPIKVEKGKLALAVLTFGGALVPAGLCSLEHHAKPDGATWAEHLALARMSTLGTGVPPLVTPGTASPAQQPKGSVFHNVELDGTLQEFQPDAGTLYSVVLFGSSNDAAHVVTVEQTLDIGAGQPYSTVTVYSDPAAPAAFKIQGPNGDLAIVICYTR